MSSEWKLVVATVVTIAVIGWSFALYWRAEIITCKDQARLEIGKFERLLDQKDAQMQIERLQGQLEAQKAARP